MLVIAMLFPCAMVPCYTENGGIPTILYVIPKSSIPCPGMPCLTLSQYAQKQDIYFSADTELRFLSGVHRLSRLIVIDSEGGTNITELALVGERQGQSKIMVSGLKLKGIKSIRMELLHFSGINILESLLEIHQV